MHLDSLEPRRHFAVGLDPTFGTAGSITFPDGSGISVGDAIATTRGSVFVELNNGRDTFVAKYTNAGRLVTGWGTNGYTKLANNPTHLAIEGGSERIYAAGVNERSRGQVVVQRLTPAGQVDTAFGTSGVLTYSPDVSDTKTTFPSLAVEGLLVRPAGRVIVAMQRSVARSIPSNDVGDRSANSQDVSLIQFQASGRDSNFANHGVATLLGGSFTAAAYDTETSQAGVFVNVTDLSAGADGGVNVVVTRQDGSNLYDTVGGGFRRLWGKGELVIKARTLSAAGVVDPNTAYSWTIQPKADDDGFTPLLTAGDGQGHVTVIGTHTVAYEDAGQFGYVLKPGVRPAATPFAVNGAVATAVTRDSAGYLYAATALNSVTKLNSGFAPLRSFGQRGTARVGDEINAFIPDPNGGVLALADDSISRLV